MNSYAVLPLIALVTNASLGIYVIYKTPKSRVNQIFGLLMISLVFWDIGEAVANSTLATKEASLIWIKIKWIGISFIGALYLNFILVFPKKKRILEKKILYVLLYLPCFVFLYLAWGTNLLIKGVDENYWGYAEIFGLAYVVYSLYLEIVLILGVYILYKAYTTSGMGVTKQQTKYVLIGGLIPIIGGSITDVILPLMDVAVVPLASIFTAGMGIFIAYAIVRYKMFAIEPKMEEYIMTKKECDLQRGCSYLVKSEEPHKSYEIFEDLVFHGVTGLCITRQYPKIIRKRYGFQKTPIIWLSTVVGENNIHPEKLALLVSMIKDFVSKTEDSVVLLDGLEYLIAHNNFQQALRMVEYLNETMMLNRSRLIIPFDSRTLDVRELALLERNMEVIED